MADILRKIYHHSESNEVRQNISLIIREIEDNKTGFDTDVFGGSRSDLGDEILNNFKELANAAGEKTIIHIDSFIDEMKTTNNASYEINDGSVADIDNPQTGLNRRDE